MATHTRGPWEVGPTVGHWAGIHAPGWRCFAQVVVAKGEDDTPTAEGEANARLIASSPELLAGCRDALRLLEELGSDGPLVRRLREAVAKAAGNAP